MKPTFNWPNYKMKRKERKKKRSVDLSLIISWYLLKKSSSAKHATKVTHRYFYTKTRQQHPKLIENFTWIKHVRFINTSIYFYSGYVLSATKSWRRKRQQQQKKETHSHFKCVRQQQNQFDMFVVRWHFFRSLATWLPYLWVCGYIQVSLIGFISLVLFLRYLLLSWCECDYVCALVISVNVRLSIWLPVRMLAVATLWLWSELCSCVVAWFVIALHIYMQVYIGWCSMQWFFCN